MPALLPGAPPAEGEEEDRERVKQCTCSLREAAGPPRHGRANQPLRLAPGVRSHPVRRRDHASPRECRRARPTAKCAICSHAEGVRQTGNGQERRPRSPPCRGNPPCRTNDDRPRPQPPACKPAPTPSPHKTRPGAVLASGTPCRNPAPNEYHPTKKKPRFQGFPSTGATGLEPATSGVTGRRSNQLSYAPAIKTREKSLATPTRPARRVCQGRLPAGARRSASAHLVPITAATLRTSSRPRTPPRQPKPG
jgi:hypothetical protein